jgi:hypothetical protein
MKSVIDTTRCVMAAVLVAALGELALAADPVKPDKPPTAAEVLSEIGLPETDRKKVLAGELVESQIAPVSERDLPVAITFVARGATPDALASDIASGAVLSSNPQVKKSGPFRGAGGLVDVSRIRLDERTGLMWAAATAGSGLNLSTAEIATFRSVDAANLGSATQQLQAMLVARFQAYKSSGLAGIAPYDRGETRTDVAGDLRAASESLSKLKKYVPALEALLLSYPSGSVPGMQETFHWMDYDMGDGRTFVLSHGIVAPLGEARVVVQRQFYVSQGYDAEQAVAVVLPTTDGTVVIYRSHTFTDQVTTIGASDKKSAGRGILTKRLESAFEKQKSVAAP